MKKLCFLLLVFVPTSLAFGQAVREAYFAGRFYDARPDVLSRQIDAFLKGAGGGAHPAEKLCALIVPHAGYSCSGSVAAHAYRAVQGHDYETVVILGTSHRGGLRGCSIYPEGGYQTPLGVAQIDSDTSREISQISGFSYSPRAHLGEHSIEVQIPFIQKVLPRAKIVPVLIGAPSPKTISILAESLARTLSGKKCLLVVSTDLSHYYSKGKANAVDNETIELIKNFQTESLTKKLQRGENIMCGGSGVVSALLYAQALGEAEIEILKYADSSSTCGPPSEVVGYLAAAVSVKRQGLGSSLSDESKKELLRLARSSIERFVRSQDMPSASIQNQELMDQKGVFVTLKKKGLLRGCIGFVDPAAPLYQTVVRAAIYASSQDPRFNPVTPGELDDIEIEISVLSPLRKIEDPSFIQVGRHGLFIRSEGRSGLLLPQVPVENGWSRKTFLEQACLKAGLPKNAWKSGVELHVFEAVIFHQ